MNKLVPNQPTSFSRSFNWLRYYYYSVRCPGVSIVPVQLYSGTVKVTCGMSHDLPATLTANKFRTLDIIRIHTPSQLCSRRFLILGTTVLKWSKPGLEIFSEAVITISVIFGLEARLQVCLHNATLAPNNSTIFHFLFR